MRATLQPVSGNTPAGALIYGYWNGRLAFVESMITVEYLRSHAVGAARLPQPARFERRGLYPTEWSIGHDPASHRYSIAFEKLVAR